MFQGLEDFDLSQRRHRHALLLIVHKNSLQSYNLSGSLLDSLVYLAASTGQTLIFK